MAGNLITSLLSLGTKLLPSIRTSAQAHCSSSSNSDNSQKERARAAPDYLERLMRTLERIKAMLYDAEEREIRDRSVKLWLKELKKVAYDAEDVLSEYRYEVTRLQVEARKASQASGSHNRKQMECIVPIPDNGMVDRLNKIISGFDEISKDREALQLRESDGVRRPNNNNILRPPTGHMVDKASIFGRDAQITEVIDFLLSEKEKEKPFSVISIVGRGGLGKTTIAQLVYNDGRVSRCFDLRGWVCVSEEFDIKRLTKATIESISKINNGVSELSPLQEELARTVEGKTILLVLDDVWNENQSLWELFRVSFKEAKMVIILVTTRNKKVANIMQITASFWPTNLPEDSCWQLFQHYAFSGTSDIVPTNLVDMGREIMRKCGGLPLAVKSIAGLLRHETDEESWRDILENDLWESNPSNDIFPALQISYAHLPAHLKPCFLFCSMYPKDYKLQKKDLIELWISHGYIESRGRRRITEIGVEYYEELKERSFLDDFSDKYSECCKLHDIIHDLARLNSENEHHSVDISDQPLNTQNKSIPQEVCHFYARGFVGYINQILQQNLKGLRTLSMEVSDCSRDMIEFKYRRSLTRDFLFPSEIARLPRFDIPPRGSAEEIDLKSKLLSVYDEFCSRDVVMCDFTKFEVLRILELKGDFTNIPNFIPELKHLVYLSITSGDLKLLPLSIGLLYNLQTLILDCNDLDCLPDSVGDLASLQFLHIQSRRVKKLPKSFGSLSNLLRLVIKCYNLEEFPFDLRNHYNLHKLEIRSHRIQAVTNTISCLRSLEELNLLPPNCSFENDHKLDFVPHGHVNFLAVKTMNATLRVRSIAWLKDMKNLEGKLYIGELKNMSDLQDARDANLRNKCKLETLYLYWNYLDDVFDYDLGRKPILSLELETCEGKLVGADDVDFVLLECLQPHPNLKNLQVRSYHSATVPEWLGDPFSLKSIQEVSLEYCTKIQSLPFGNLHTLKRLTIRACSSIRVFQLEQLPSQLKMLKIDLCHGLELITGLGDQNMLTALWIFYCKALKSLTMDELQLVESTKPFGDCSHEMPHIDRQSISSLTRLQIENCKLLCVLPDGLIPSGSCFVWVHGCGCRDLEIRPM